MANAVNFDYGSNLYFTTKEIRKIEIEHIQKEDEYWDQSGYYERQLIGKTYKRITVIIRQDDADTITKIETLFNQVDTYKQPVEIDFYYRLLIDSSYIVCKMDRSKFEKLYYRHSRSARDIMLEFIETE